MPPRVSLPVRPARRILSGFFLSIALPLCGQTDQAIYTDSLQSGWQNWGWATLNYANPSPVNGGSSSISVKINASGEAIYLAHTGFDTSPYSAVRFWVHGGTAGGQLLQVVGHAAGAVQSSVQLSPLTTNWQEITVPLAGLGCASRPDMDGIWVQDRAWGAQPVFYLDDISLLAGTSSPPVTNVAVTIAVDAQRDRRAISPLIYGVAFASTAQLAELNAPLNRSGGNAETRYNWELNAHNRGNDWYFESLADGSATPGAEADNFVQASVDGGAEPMLTVPMIGWVPKLGPARGRLASYSIAKYGPQTGNDWEWFPDAGNGVGTNSVTHATWLITTNDPNDANFQTNSAFQDAWLDHLIGRWGTSTNGGVRYYLLDNEHSIWHSTHRDVHPVGATMAEIRDKMVEYAALVKSNDPNALVLGPEEFGWSGYFYSGYDLQYGDQHGWGYLPDRAANGNWDYMPWLLNQLHQSATNSNLRLLDYFTLHCYPERGDVSGSDVSTATQLVRNRLTRKFWDTNYVDQTWINDVVKLIPRMKQWVAAYYPDTKIGITEYNWGAENHMNGATAQADLYGIFGREGLDLATRWTTPLASTPTFKAMKMFRNYDNAGSTFGDTSVSAGGPDPDEVAPYAAVRDSDGALTVMVINKQLTASAGATVTLTNYVPGGPAQVWQLTAANTISRLSDVALSGNAFSNTVPPQSITLYVVPAGAVASPLLRDASITSTNTVLFRLEGQAGQRYAIQAGTDFSTWQNLQTNTLSGSSLWVSLPATNAFRFYRAQWVPW